jgi:hypothetical protein
VGIILEGQLAAEQFVEKLLFNLSGCISSPIQPEQPEIFRRGMITLFSRACAQEDSQLLSRDGKKFQRSV